MVDVTVAVQVAKAALREVGRGDLADQVEQNRAGWPCLKAHEDGDEEVIVRAFLLGHKAAGHHRAILMAGGILCHDCHPEIWR